MADHGNTSGKNGFKSVLEWALFYLENGLSIIPLKPKSKEPAVKSWKEYQEHQPSVDEVKQWFTKCPDCNIGIICGKASGNLIVIDFDNPEVLREFGKRLEKEGSLALKDKVTNTWRVATSRGAHFYFRLPPEATIRTVPGLHEGIDIKGEGGYVVAPPSIHPSGVEYTFHGDPRANQIQELWIDEFKELLQLLGADIEKLFKKPRKRGEEKEVRLEERELTEKEILELYEIIKPAYKPGGRELLVGLYLCAWFIKAGIKRDSLKKLAKMLAEYDRDVNNSPDWDKKLQRILRQIDYHYNTRAFTRGLAELKGKTGVQEILENVMDESRALEVIRRIEEILKVSSPFRDSVIEILDYEKQLYAVANLRKLVIVRARRTDEGLVYKERITVGAPTEVTVYVNPLGGITKYEVKWEARTRPRPLVIGPAPIEDVVERLKAEGLVLNHRLVRDAINAIIEGYIRKKKAILKEEIEAPGFYWVDGQLIAVRIENAEPDREKLREALIFLDELVDKWFSHARERLATVIKWGVIAPFIFARKQRDKWVPWLYIYGSSFTGKTTMAELILNMWRLDNRHRKTGASIDTPARLGHVLSQSTYPVLINEPGNAINREDTVEIMKNAIESTLARGKYIRGTYMDIPSLAPLVFTSNKVLPRDDALVRRLLIIKFTYGERVDKDKATEFKTRVKPMFRKLSALGDYIVSHVMENPEIIFDDDWMSVAEKLLRYAYIYAGISPPEWLKLRHDPVENIYETITEMIRGHMVKLFNDSYNRWVGRVVEVIDGHENYIEKTLVKLRDRIKIVLENNLIPWAIMKNNGKIILTTGFAEEMRNIIGDIGGLKSLAELLGWEYRRGIKIGKKTIQGVIVDLDDLIEFLYPHAMETEQPERENELDNLMNALDI